MEIKGKIIDCLPVKSGQSSNGEWRKQEYVLETASQYSKKICFMVWGEKIEQFAIQKGESIEVSIDLESREYNGRWYTDVKAWKVSRDTSGEDPMYSVRADNSHPETFAILNGDDIPF